MGEAPSAEAGGGRRCEVIPFLADHCFDEDILRAVIRRNPSIDFVLARDEGLQEAEDPDILAWAAQEGRVVITLDRNTMIAFALERIRHRQPMAGLVVINQFAPPCCETITWPGPSPMTQANTLKGPS